MFQTHSSDSSHSSEQRSRLLAVSGTAAPPPAGRQRYCSAAACWPSAVLHCRRLLAVSSTAGCSSLND
ncbi:Hypothetical predicted protein [Scomber scombrus]|uniref:Uncharacterized protein n=1 Tax=Scomber scombrus TaxID=13677 RepID=A0AAV1PWT3_SCOSC